jgi:hypothetical protein
LYFFFLPVALLQFRYIDIYYIKDSVLGARIMKFKTYLFTRSTAAVKKKMVIEQPIEEVLSENLTPASLRCSLGACPAIHRTSNGNFLIIGKKPSQSLKKEIEGKVADDEWAIVVDPALLANISKR